MRGTRNGLGGGGGEGMEYIWVARVERMRKDDGEIMEHSGEGKKTGRNEKNSAEPKVGSSIQMTGVSQPRVLKWNLGRAQLLSKYRTAVHRTACDHNIVRTVTPEHPRRKFSGFTCPN